MTFFKINAFEVCIDVFSIQIAGEDHILGEIFICINKSATVDWNTEVCTITKEKRRLFIFSPQFLEQISTQKLIILPLVSQVAFGEEQPGSSLLSVGKPGNSHLESNTTFKIVPCLVLSAQQ